MKVQDKGRKWMWCFLGGVVASQFYVVQELFVVFAFFAIAFVAIAFVVVSLYTLQKGWELALARVGAASQGRTWNSVVLTSQLRAEVVAEVGNRKQELERKRDRSRSKLAA
jgi:hypothetical protein